MDALARPLTSTEAPSTGSLVALRCPAHTERGRCQKLLGKVHEPRAAIDVQVACPRCHTLTTFRLIPRSIA